MEISFHGGSTGHAIERIVFVLLLLLSVAAAPALAQVPSSSATGLLFEFSPAISDSGWQAVLTALSHNDLSRLFGRPVLLVQRKRVSQGTEFFDVVQVALRGDCAVGRDIGSNKDKGPLGWVYLADRRIEPFVFVDCDRIAVLLQAELRERPSSERQRVMACAISYVVVHELTHIVTQNPEHQLAGALKAHATKTDLLAGASGVLLGGSRRVSTFVGCPVNQKFRTALLEDHVRVDADSPKGAPCITPPCQR